MKTVISLCDYTGQFVQPWVDAGYHAVLVDPQHGFHSTEGLVTKLAWTIEEAMPYLAEVLAHGDIAFVAGWPPCRLSRPKSATCRSVNRRRSRGFSRPGRSSAFMKARHRSLSRTNRV